MQAPDFDPLEVRARCCCHASETAGTVFRTPKKKRGPPLLFSRLPVKISTGDGLYWGVTALENINRLKNTLLAEQVQDQIYRYILDTPLRAGDKLPNEFQLCEMFGVGRSTVREAVKILTYKGILEIRRGAGTYVVSTIPGGDPLGLQNFEDKAALALDLADIRLILEPGICELATQHATAEDIKKLTRLCERVETKIHTGENHSADDIAFHTGIAECAKNKVVEQLIPIIDTAVMMFVNVTSSRFLDETIETHRAILNAIAEHDPIGARMAMTMHLGFNRNAIKQMLFHTDEKDQ